MENEQAIIKMYDGMLKYQGEWADIYNQERKKRLYEKGRAEKARAKQHKQNYLATNNINGNKSPNSEAVQQPCDCQETS